MSDPTVKIEDDGSLTLDWPADCGHTTTIARDVLEEMVASLNELNEWRSGKRRSLWTPNPQQEVNP